MQYILNTAFLANKIQSVKESYTERDKYRDTDGIPAYFWLLNGSKRYPVRGDTYRDRNSIGIFMPTRNRPNKLLRAIQSLEDTASHPEKIRLLLYVDADDKATIDALRKRGSFKIAVYTFVNQPVLCISQASNYMWQNDPVGSKFYMVMVDDQVMATRGWDTIIFDRYSQCQDDYVLFYPNDENNPELATMPIVTAEWLDAMGWFHSEQFFFWFEDMWLDEIAQMVQRRIKLDIDVLSPEGKGKTPRMHNLPFWQMFYLLMADVRMAFAEIMRSKIYCDESQRVKSRQEGLKVLEKTIRRHTHSLEDLVKAEEIYSDPEYMRVQERIRLYECMEAQAVAKLKLKAHYERNSGDEQLAEEIAKAIKLADIYKNKLTY